MLLEIASILSPIATTVVLFFLARLLNKVDKLADKSSVLSTDLSLLKDRLSTLDRLSDKLQTMRDEFAQMKNDLSVALIAASKVRTLEDELAVLKRDQQSIWRNIDELKGGNHGFRVTVKDFGRDRD